METLSIASAEHVGRALSNAAMFAGKAKGGRLILQSIHCVLEGRTLELVATDSYSLYHEVLDVDYAGAPRTFRIYATDAVMVAKAAKAATLRDAVTIGFDEKTITLVVGTQTFALRDVSDDGDYPNWKRLLSDDIEAVDSIGLGADQIARLAKIVPTSGGKATLRLTFNGSLKAFRFTVGSAIDGAVMPCRLS